MKFDVGDYLKARSISYSANENEAITTCLWCFRERHLYINLKTGNYICFRCGEHGKKLLGVICQLENCTFSEAIQFLQRNEPKPRRLLTLSELREKVKGLGAATEENSDGKFVDVPAEFIPVYKDKKWRYPVYLKERGISKECSREFGLGYCEKGRYANRIILPYACPTGSGFTARDITGFAKQKYLNVQGANRRALLYGWRRDENTTGDIVLCEGGFDVLRLFEHGIAALGLLGKTLSQGQLSLLSKFPADTSITIMLDPDLDFEPLNIAKKLSTRFQEIFLAKLPPNIDPGDSTAEQAWEAIDKAEKIGSSRIKLSQKKLFHVKRRFFELNN